MKRIKHCPFTLTCLVVILSAVGDPHAEGRANAGRQGSSVGVAPGVPRPGPNGWGTEDERGNGNTH
jgi:hypothetical protein